MDWEPRVGMPVLCVSDLNGHRAFKSWSGSIPTRGGVYFIREVLPDPRRGFSGVFLRLREIVNRPYDSHVGPFEAAFAVKHFRPLDERRIDVFRQILVDCPLEVA